LVFKKSKFSTDSVHP